jgi:hypothetical protein
MSTLNRVPDDFGSHRQLMCPDASELRGSVSGADHASGSELSGGSAQVVSQRAIARRQIRVDGSGDAVDDGLVEDLSPCPMFKVLDRHPDLLDEIRMV